MEQLIEAMIERLVRKEMELTSIPAFIRDLANSIVANPSIHYLLLAFFKSRSLYSGLYHVGVCRFFMSCEKWRFLT